jgi:hypothetical protein
MFSTKKILLLAKLSSSAEASPWPSKWLCTAPIVIAGTANWVGAGSSYRIGALEQNAARTNLLQTILPPMLPHVLPKSPGLSWPTVAPDIQYPKANFTIQLSSGSLSIKKTLRDLGTHATGGRLYRCALPRYSTRHNIPPHL